VTDLDLVGLGGLELVEAVARVRQIPIFALVPAIRTDNTRIAFAAHGLGVIAVHPKPDQPDGWAELGRTLESSILETCGKTRVDSFVSDRPVEVPAVRQGLRFVAVGASTGGPGALCEMLRAFGGSAGIGVAVVQHIAAGFEKVLAEWLAAETGLDVATARDGERLSPGSVRFAVAGGHLLLARDGVLHMDRSSPAVNGHNPSVDVLFRSLADHPPGTAAAVLLSGMGADGAEGMAELRRANVLTVAQEPASCAVFGMPRVAIEMGAVTFTLAPAQIGRLLTHAGGAGR
jgi:two-component system chemotaxis response regulator CheB